MPCLACPAYNVARLMVRQAHHERLLANNGRSSGRTVRAEVRFRTPAASHFFYAASFSAYQSIFRVAYITVASAIVSPAAPVRSE
jgi:hypothetical protein